MIVYRLAEIKQGTGFARDSQFVQLDNAELAEIAQGLRVAAGAYRHSAKLLMGQLPSVIAYERKAVNAEAAADAFQEMII